MANQIWIGNSAAIAQVWTLTVAGTAAAGQVYSVTINGKIVSYTAIGGDTNATIATALVNVLSTSQFPEFQEARWASPSAGVLTATAATPGMPIVLTSAATGTGTFVSSITTASSGPNDVSLAANWSTGTLPASGDSIYFQASTVPALYGLQALAAVAPALIQIDASYTAPIGLPVNSPSGYREYRPRYLQFTGATNVLIGEGQGAGSGKIQLDFQSANFKLTLWKTGTSSEQGMPAVLLKGGSSTTTINVQKGTLGLALLAGEVATVPTLNTDYVNNQKGDAQVYAGPGAVLTTITQSGGSVICQCPFTTLTSYGGWCQALAGNPTNVNLYNAGSGAPASTLLYSTGGTITNNIVQKGCLLDCSGTVSPVILTNSTWYAGASVNGPAGNVSMSNAALIPDGQVSDVSINLGVARHVLVS